MAHDLETYHRWRKAAFSPKADFPLSLDWTRRTADVCKTATAKVAALCSQILGESGISARPMAAGTWHHVWRIERLNGPPLVFRANVRGDDFRDFAMLIDQAIGESFIGPRVLHVDLTRAHYPTDFALLEKADGVSLCDFDHDDVLIEPHLHQLGAALARLHQIPVEGFGLFDVRGLRGGRLLGGHDSWDFYLRTALDSHARQCVHMDALTMPEANRIHELFDENRELFATVEPRLLHGDVGNHNVFVDPRGAITLIDWEDALAGDPVHEVAFWATFHPERRHAAFLEGYQTEAALPDDFEPRFWLSFLRVSLAKTVLRHRLGIQDRPGREPAVQRVRKSMQRLEEALVHG